MPLNRFSAAMFRSPFSPAAAQNKSDSGYMKGPQTADTWGQLSDANFPKLGQIAQLRTRTYYLVDDVIRSPEIVFGTWSDLFALMMMPRASRWRSSGNSSSRKRLSTARHGSLSRIRNSIVRSFLGPMSARSVGTASPPPTRGCSNRRFGRYSYRRLSARVPAQSPASPPSQSSHR